MSLTQSTMPFGVNPVRRIMNEILSDLDVDPFLQVWNANNQQLVLFNYIL